MSRRRYASQRGITLIVGLIFLVLITIMVTMAFTLNKGNLKSVGNMQARNESIAAANQAIESVLSAQLAAWGNSALPVGGTVLVDVNKDGTNDYSVVVGTPTCVKSTMQGISGTGMHSSVTLGASFDITNNYVTLWEMVATVSDLRGSGASVVIKQGVSATLTKSQYEGLQSTGSLGC